MSKSKGRNLSHAAPAASASRKTNGMDLSPDKNNNNPGVSKGPFKKSKDYEKYSLRPRSIQNRIETERRQKGEVKKEPKPKSKPPPLSKYRRKTANARERSRMREINTAYEILQKSVPQYPVLPTNAQGKTCEKLTKITTLRLAMNYIQSLQSMLNKPGGSGGVSSSTITSTISSHDIESDTDSIGNSIVSPSSSASPATPSTSSSCNASINSGSGSEFSPASSYTMSPMSSCSPVGPDCIQTVMRSVVSPAAAAAISANAANLNNLNLNNVSLSSLTSSPASLGIPHQSITTIVTIPSHPHAQAQYSRQLPPTVHHLHHHQPQQLHHHHTLPPPPPPPRPPVQVATSSSCAATAYLAPSAMTSASSLMQPQQKQIMLQQHHHHHHQSQLIQLGSLQIPNSTSSSNSIAASLTPQNPLLCSTSPLRSSATVVSSSSNNNNNLGNINTHLTTSTLVSHAPNSPVIINSNKMKLPPIATTLSSALLRKSMSSFLTDCVQLTNGVNVSMNNIIGSSNNSSININGGCNNNGHRTGSLSSLTESDFSEYTNDLLSDEGSVLDEPMFEDLIGVGADFDLLLGTEHLGFTTADLSAI